MTLTPERHHLHLSSSQLRGTRQQPLAPPSYAERRGIPGRAIVPQMHARINHREHEPSGPGTELRQVSPETLPETWQGASSAGTKAPHSVLSRGGGTAVGSKRTSALIVTRGRSDGRRESAGTGGRALEQSAKAAYFE